MSSPQSDKTFVSSVAKFYDEYFVPLIFAPYAEDIARRLATRRLARVLEIAAGTGVVTRRLASLLPDDVSIVATDLNQPTALRGRS
jgi:ubiquinone/menaquinone biosynthesis C-methylase UbiE